MKEGGFEELVQLIQKATFVAANAAMIGRYGSNYHSQEQSREAAELFLRAKQLASKLDGEEQCHEA